VQRSGQKLLNDGKEIKCLLRCKLKNVLGRSGDVISGLIAAHRRAVVVAGWAEVSVQTSSKAPKARNVIAWGQRPRLGIKTPVSMCRRSVKRS